VNRVQRPIDDDIIPNRLSKIADEVIPSFKRALDMGIRLGAARFAFCDSIDKALSGIESFADSKDGKNQEAP
jgi:hypothetical protein